jgi:hypothetical protein
VLVEDLWIEARLRREGRAYEARVRVIGEPVVQVVHGAPGAKLLGRAIAGEVVTGVLPAFSVPRFVNITSTMFSMPKPTPFTHSSVE